MIWLSESIRTHFKNREVTNHDVSMSLWSSAMIEHDKFKANYGDEIDWEYDCVDRIVMNGMFPLGQTPGGFRHWWRKLFGDDGKLNDDGIRAMAGEYSRRVSGWAKKNHVPVLNCVAGERKDEKAEPFVREAEALGKTGVFLILTGLAPAPVWRVRVGKSGKIHDIYRQKPWPFVKHYHFHLMDRNWGHVIIRFCGYPPYGTQVILNGHEWVKRQVELHGRSAKTDDNCFVDGARGSIRYYCGLLTKNSAGPMIRGLCESWVLGTALSFALNRHDREKSDFQYDWRVYQIEYSRNYIFRSGRTMDEIYQGLIDRNRSRLDVKNLKTIFGVRSRPHKRLRSANEPRGRRDAVFKEVASPEYDLTVFKLHWRYWSLKLYDKGARLLRGESVEHNVKKGKTRGRVDRWGEIVEDLKGRLIRFLNAVELLDHGLLDKGRLDFWRRPSEKGKKRLAGIDIENARMRVVLNAVISLAHVPEGFTRSKLIETIKKQPGWRDYKPHNASYDLRKLRGKGVLETRPGSLKNHVNTRNLREIATRLIIREKVLKPICAKSAGKFRQKIESDSALGEQYENVRADFENLFEILNLEVAA